MMTRDLVQNASPVIGNIILFKICIRKILEASVGTSSRADGKAPLLLDKFVTANRRGGLTEACADGKLMPIFGCRQPSPVAAHRRRVSAVAHILVRITPRASLSVVNVVCYQAEISPTGRSLLQRIPTKCVSLRVIRRDNNHLHLQ